MLFTFNCKAEENNIKYYSDDMGILSLMYHRFDEDKYPSTNIQMSIFKEHIKIIKKLRRFNEIPIREELNKNTLTKK